MSAEMFEVAFTAVAMIGATNIWFRTKNGLSEAIPDEEEAFASAAMDSDEPFVIEDLTTDSRFSQHPAVTGAPGIRFFAGIPFHSPDGRRIGVYSVFDTKPNQFTNSKIAHLREIGRWIERELALSEELDRAAEVQRALLPRDSAVLDGYEVAGACVPATALGGDFFDWYPIAGGLGFTLGDVMGKGIGAAIIAATVRAVVRSAAHKKNVAVAVRRASSTLAADLDVAGSFVTLFHARLRASDGRVLFVDAGHGLSFVARADGSTKRLTSLDLPLGVAFDDDWGRNRLTLEPGDQLVTFSDGVLDLFDGTLDSLDRVAELAHSVGSAQDLVDAVQRLATRSGAPDDVTIVAVRRNAR